MVAGQFSKSTTLAFPDPTAETMGQPEVVVIKESSTNELRYILPQIFITGLRYAQVAIYEAVGSVLAEKPAKEGKGKVVTTAVVSL